MLGTQSTASSGGSERYPFPADRGRTSSSSASVHSPVSIETRSDTSSFGDDWTDLGQLESSDGIEPSDSASRSRASTSRRNTTEAPQPPQRRHSSRRTTTSTHVRSEREEPRRRESYHRSRSSRHHRSESRRLPSDESTSTLATDDHPYHHGQRSYAGAYRHVPPPHTHGGYPPSMSSAAPGYIDPFQQAQALVHMPQTDPFGYPTGNPFSTHAPANPFSPMAAPAPASGYFPQEPAPAPSMHRPAPRSVYSSDSYSSQMYHPQAIAYPGYPPIYPQMPYMYPPGQATSLPPQAMAGAADGTSKELENLRELIRKHEEERVAREKAMIAKAEADAAERAARRAKEEEEAKKKEEIAAASAKAKKDAEEAAAGVAKKAKEESDKKLAEAEKAKKEAEEKKKELEDEIKKNKPNPDSSKEPIKFKDAVHRKFSFPWGICKTWKGTEGLIKQAFAHVDVLGEHVHQGHYDLLGPDGEIILPQVWETTVQPGWEIEMHMWPIAELKEPDRRHGHHGHGGAGDPFAGMAMHELMQGLDLGNGTKSGKKAGKGSKKDKNRKSMVEVPLAPPMHQDPLMAGLFPPGMLPGGIGIVKETKPSKSKSSSSKKKQEPGLIARWMGAPPAKKDDEKLGAALMVRRKSTSSANHGQQAQQQEACLLM